MAKKPILTDKIKHSLDEFREALLKKGIPVEKMILFGSYAKGKARFWSDLDVCIVSKKFGKDPYDDLVMLLKLVPDTDITIEPHPYHPKDLTDRWDPLASEIHKYGIVI